MRTPIRTYLLLGSLLASHARLTHAEGPVSTLDVCQTNLVAPSAAALLAPIEKPALVKTLAQAHQRIANAKDLLRHYLTAEDYELLQKTKGAKPPGRNDPDTDSAELKLLNAIFERARQALYADFAKHEEFLKQSLAAKRDRAIEMNNQASVARITGVIEHLKFCAEPVFERCAQVWYEVRRMRQLDLPDMRPTETAMGPTHRPIDEVDKLDVLRSKELKWKFKQSLEDAFRNEDSAKREERRLADEVRNGRPATDEFTFVPDLNKALHSLFKDVLPHVGTPRSKSMLRGTLDVAGKPVSIEVMFDPRQRYFTVVPALQSALDAEYYQLRVTAGGELEFVNGQTMTRLEAGDHLSTTHFRY